MSKLMIVDDASFMRESIKLMVKDEDFEVVAEAANGIDAVDKYKIHSPDIVTMDITMPKMSGIEALKRIKEIDKDAKIIMVSAMGQEVLIRQAVLNGAINFIVKPFLKDKLLDVLKSVQ